MNSTFIPRMQILSSAQKTLWPMLKNMTDLGFVLYGGTGAALQLGHRSSIDFDFFSDSPFTRETLIRALPVLNEAETLLEAPNSLTVRVPCKPGDEDKVKVSFFGDLKFGRVGSPSMTHDGVLRVASLEDLLATKLKVILQRAEVKDYQDIAAILRSGYSLSRGLSAAQCLFGTQFQPSVSLKALVYFQDGDLAELGVQDKKALVAAVTGVADLPKVDPCSTRLF